MITPLQLWSWGLSAGLLFSSLVLTHCTHDIYQEQADFLKDHSGAFYNYLTADRVEQAIRENERIEAMASDMGRNVRSRVAQGGTMAVGQEFALMKTANDTAATNWLSLGHYFSVKKEYARARATYQRVLNTYTNSTDRPAREQATRALQDIDILDPPAAKNP